MALSVRYGQYLRDASHIARQISYNLLTPKIKRDENNKIIPHVHPPVKLQFMDVYRLLKNYIQGRFMEQFKAVVPLAIYLMLFQLLILNQVVEDSWSITFGLFGVIVGLMLFMEGLKLGLMPFGETIGHTLPQKSTLPVVLTVAFLLGVGVTFAEPAIGSLKTAGQIVSVEAAPYLYTLLNDWADIYFARHHRELF